MILTPSIAITSYTGRHQENSATRREAAHSSIQPSDMSLNARILCALLLCTILALAWARPADEVSTDLSDPQRETSATSTLFDDIFNIPISVLKAVQRLLSNNQQNGGAKVN